MSFVEVRENYYSRGGRILGERGMSSWEGRGGLWCLRLGISVSGLPLGLGDLLQAFGMDLFNMADACMGWGL